MPTHSPLPMRHGLRAAWVRTPDRNPADPAPWPTMRAFLRAKLPADVDVDAMLHAGRFVDDEGRRWNGGEPYRPHTFVHFHRDLRDEPELPFALDVLHVDERIVVVDKPHFMATIPRGRHVTQSVVVKARTVTGDFVLLHRDGRPDAAGPGPVIGEPTPGTGGIQDEVRPGGPGPFDPGDRTPGAGAR